MDKLIKLIFDGWEVSFNHRGGKYAVTATREDGFYNNIAIRLVVAEAGDDLESCLSSVADKIEHDLALIRQESEKRIQVASEHYFRD